MVGERAVADGRGRGEGMPVVEGASGVSRVAWMVGAEGRS